MTSTDQLTYERVRTELSALVLDGQYRVGDKLPSEKDLADRFGLGRGSIREALKRLQDDGLVHRRPGQGTFFSQPPPMYLLGASLLVPDLRHGPQPRVVHAELLDEAADAAWFAALRPPASATAGRPVLHLCRVHQHPHPIAVEDLWLDHLSVPTLYSRLRGARSDVGAVDFELALIAHGAGLSSSRLEAVPPDTSIEGLRLARGDPGHPDRPLFRVRRVARGHDSCLAVRFLIRGPLVSNTGDPPPLLARAEEDG